MKLFPLLVASSIAEKKSVKFVTGVTSVSAEFPSDIIDLSRDLFSNTFTWRFKTSASLATCPTLDTRLDSYFRITLEYKDFL